MVDALPGSMKDPFRDCEVGAEPSCNVIANKNFENYRKECIEKWNTAARMFRPGAPPPKKNSDEWKLNKVWNNECSHIRKTLPSVDQPLYPTSLSIDAPPTLQMFLPSERFLLWSPVDQFGLRPIKCPRVVGSNADGSWTCPGNLVFKQYRENKQVYGMDCGQWRYRY